MYLFIITLIFMLLYLDDHDIVTSIYDIHNQLYIYRKLNYGIIICQTKFHFTAK